MYSNVYLQQPFGGPQYTQQQTNAASNYQRAMADQAGNPRYTSKQYQRPGLSSSKGTDYAGAAEAAQAYAKGMAGGEAARMGDAYYNANQSLDEQVRRSQFGTALAALNEQRNQAQAMHNLQSMGNATGFMGNVFQDFMGNMFDNRQGNSFGLNSLLSGLL